MTSSIAAQLSLPATQPALLASTQRTIGWIIAVLIIAAMVIYWLFNWFQNKDEIGAEIELAPNRKPQWDDDLLETKRLDMALTAGLVTLAITAITLPLYWLAEPGRQEGAVEFTEGRWVVAGEGLYNENCAQCHGSVDGPGGDRSFSIVDNNGNFVEQVEWRVPSLGSALYRFSEEEVRYVLDYGRTNSPMPAWGAAGGGPLTAQQIDHVIQYIADQQMPATEIAERVELGIPDAAFDKVLRDDADARVAYYTAVNAVDHAENDEAADAAKAEFDAIEASITESAAALVAASETDEALYGELLFTNPIDAGSYGCARCHSGGWSYRADEFAGKAEAAGETTLLDPVVHGGGALGPNLTNGATLRQFSDAPSMEGFISAGAEDGKKYGNFGQGDGGGQMPAFGTCVGDRDTAERKPLEGMCDKEHIRGAGMLTSAQIKAIVAYERGLTTDEPAAPAPAPDPEPEPEPEPEPAAPETGRVNATFTVDNTTDPATIVLTGEVLNETQRRLLVDAANETYGPDNVTDELVIIDLDPEIPDADDRVDEMADLIEALGADGILSGSANLDGEALTVRGLAASFDARDAANAAAQNSGGVALDAEIDVDAASAIRGFDLSGVEFETSGSNLTADAQIILDDVAEQLAAFPDVAVEVQGHTDDRGSESSNQSLSQSRAESVVAYLVDAGIDQERLSAVGYGEEQPIDDNGTAEGRQNNRRVQFEVLES